MTGYEHNGSIEDYLPPCDYSFDATVTQSPFLEGFATTCIIPHIFLLCPYGQNFCGVAVLVLLDATYLLFFRFENVHSVELPN